MKKMFPNKYMTVLNLKFRLMNIGSKKSVLLSTDYIPRAIIFELQRVWGCDVFQHYGMTEM